LPDQPGADAPPEQPEENGKPPAEETLASGIVPAREHDEDFASTTVRDRLFQECVEEQPLVASHLAAALLAAALLSGAPGWQKGERPDRPRVRRPLPRTGRC
jgi:hypothetical protein